MSGNSNLLRIVQVSQCDIDFWTQQITEHTLFLHNLLNPNSVPTLKDEAKQHYSAWYSLLHKNPISYDANMMASLYAFLEVIHNKIGTNTFARKGNVPPINIDLSIDDFHALIKHMIQEQTYFVRLVEGKITIKDELLFWAQENAEHTELISHLLPAGDLKNQAAEISDSLKRTRVLSIYDQAIFSDELPLIKRSNNSAALIHGFVHSKQISSIDDAMLEHEIREARKGEERVQYLLGLL